MKNNYISVKTHEFFGKDQTPLQWQSVKISFIVAVLIFFIHILWNVDTLPFPSGICKYMDCAYLTRIPVRYITVAVLIALSLAYILERWMIACTFSFFILSMVILSLDESNGNPAETGILSLIFLSQFLAYVLYTRNQQSRLSYHRMQFTAQFFAAAYVLSAVSKIKSSGLMWFMDDNPKITLEIMRIYSQQYVSSLDVSYLHRASSIVTFLLAHVLVIKILLGMALLIELFSFVIMINKKIAFFYAFLLTALHAGIYFILGIFFPTFTIPVIIFFINPLYWTIVISQYSFQELTGTSPKAP